ncbi:hypothetical protein BTA51_18930 [Hahella sp. CCB-MM4]|uniref:hypothetical protein n=1 Tax=Hahella sp. (strain CCB-MM4) TaxID=1926491 RepID=UPI000B9C0E0E|nr:hypothetical protein [Hahella sp. CCB-MM4]OZG71718.1 hypothetical protein BTA51_18930 [Hahella sp. CCB-MM4]
MNACSLFAKGCLLSGFVLLSANLAAVEQLDESGLAEIHFPGLPAASAGTSLEVDGVSQQIAETATAEAHAHVRKEMIVANETPNQPNSPAVEEIHQEQLQRTSLVTYSEITQSNNQVENSLAEVVINFDKADNYSHSHDVDKGVNINLSNTVNQVEISNMRSTLSTDDNRGNFAIQSMSVEANIIIQSR